MSEHAATHHMRHQPQIRERSAQPYVAIRAHVTTEAEFRRAADTGFPELFGWLGRRGVEPAGPPFIRYLRFDPAGEPADIELAVPVTAEASADGRVRADVLPPGRWLTLLHVGPYTHATEPDLRAAHAALEAWMDEHGIAVDRADTDAGSAVRGCTEQYLTGPADEADHSRWETELAYLTAGG